MGGRGVSCGYEMLGGWGLHYSKGGVCAFFYHSKRSLYAQPRDKIVASVLTLRSVVCSNATQKILTLNYPFFSFSFNSQKKQ